YVNFTISLNTHTIVPYLLEPGIDYTQMIFVVGRGLGQFLHLRLQGEFFSLVLLHLTPYCILCKTLQQPNHQHMSECTNENDETCGSRDCMDRPRLVRRLCSPPGRPSMACRHQGEASRH